MDFRTYLNLRVAIVLLSLAGLVTPEANAFIIDPTAVPWSTTASGERSRNGLPGTLTWSIVPDGTQVFDGVENLGGSNLIAFLNENFDGDESETDHTNQPWFPIFEGSMNRWAELSGLSFVYEPNDDGGNHDDKPGELGVRGDIRISGAPIDGRGRVLAFNFLPEFGGDMAIDTDETSFANERNDHRFFRNTIMHELGHAFGLSHVTSDSDRLLMDPFTDAAIEGPQLDEVRGIHYHFGDRFEAGNGEAGNDTVSLASDLGALVAGGSIAVGADANVSSQLIPPGATDFVSISNENDVDFYSFAVSQSSSFSGVLTPLGGVFTQGQEFDVPIPFDANIRNDLSLTLLDSDGSSVLGFADDTIEGETETLDSIEVTPGTYFLRIEGKLDGIQLYMLDLSLAAPILTGDCNGDGIVDAGDLDCACASDLTTVLAALDSPLGDFDLDGEVAFSDFLTLANHFGDAGGYAQGDLDCSGEISFADFLVLARGFGDPVAAAESVPEPQFPLPTVIGLLALLARRCRNK